MTQFFEMILGIKMSEITTIFLIAQFIGLLTTIISVCSVQFKKMKYIIIMMIIGNSLSAVSFILLGGYSGAIICFVAIIQSYVSYLYQKKDKKIPILYTSLFIILYTVVSVFTYKGFNDIFSFACAITYALAIIQKKPSIYRIFIVVNSLSWIIYDYNVQAFTLIITFSMTLISTLIAIARLDINKKRKLSEL